MILSMLHPCCVAQAADSQRYQWCDRIRPTATKLQLRTISQKPVSSTPVPPGFPAIYSAFLHSVATGTALQSHPLTGLHDLHELYVFLRPA